MDKLEKLYEQLKKLRAEGVKMKDIATSADIPSSVLSSIYSSVLPDYTAMLAGGIAPDNALDDALKKVTNVSRRRLEGCVDDLYAYVCGLSSSIARPRDGEGTLLGDIGAAAGRYLCESRVYAGLYTGYSFSFHSGCMKAEPYMITSAVEDDSAQHVYCRTIDGKSIEGIGLFSPFQAGYMLFNERRNMQFALKTVCLRLPVMSFPHYIKGICLSHDYNCNPVARRIILVREGDEIPFEDFSGLEARLIDNGKLDGDLKAYYDYTCKKGDVVRSMIFTSPGKGVEDLLREKEILDRT